MEIQRRRKSGKEQGGGEEGRIQRWKRERKGEMKKE